MSKKQKKNRYEIPFPVLYDTRVYSSNTIVDFFRRKRVETLRAERKGYYNYETDRFEIPKKDFAAIEKNPNFANELAIIKRVGYLIVEENPKE